MLAACEEEAILVVEETPLRASGGTGPPGLKTTEPAARQPVTRHTQSNVLLELAVTILVSV